MTYIFILEEKNNNTKWGHLKNLSLAQKKICNAQPLHFNIKKNNKNTTKAITYISCLDL